MVEGEKLFDIAIRWPKWRRSDETSILDIPVDIINNQVVLAQGSGFTPSAFGHALTPPSTAGSLARTDNPISSSAPRLRLRDLVSPVDKYLRIQRDGSFIDPGASTIYRSNGKRMIAIKFSVRGRDLGSAVAEAKEKTKDLWQVPYHPVWSGEFEQMEEANGRLMWMIPLSLALIMVMQYAHFRSIIDTIVIMTNVFDVFVGGVWSLYLTGTNFSVSAAMGFVSLFGIAHMEGLLLISYFNALRAQGLPLHEAIIQGSLKRVRPVMITAMTAILGLLPAAVSTKMGAQTAQPLAIVVVGGMTVTLFLDRYLMPVLYSFYGHREPPAGSGSMAH
jgi:heavy metal efflux system protein